MKPAGSALEPTGRIATVRAGLPLSTGEAGVTAARRDATELNMPGEDARRLPHHFRVGVAGQHHYVAVARSGHGSGAHAAAEEGELSDRLARTDLRNYARPAVERDDEAPGQHDVELVRGIALTDEDRAAEDAQPYGFLCEPAPVGLRQLRKPRHGREGVPSLRIGISLAHAHASSETCLRPLFFSCRRAAGECSLRPGYVIA